MALLTVAQIATKVNRLKAANAERDGRHRDVLAVRRGDVQTVVGDIFPEDWPKPIVANFVETAARDVAEMIAPLPAFNCSTANMVSDSARKFADKKTKIASYYVLHSDLETQMLSGADQYGTFSFLPFLVEPDFDAGCPRISIINPFGTYPERDKWGRTISFSQRILKPAAQLAAEYPEYASLILGDRDRENTSTVEVILYRDADQTVLFLPAHNNTVLHRVKNPLGKCPVEVAWRPGIDPEDPRGQFDDVIWIQLARAKMAVLGLEAADKSVRAPLAVPDDVNEITFGADSIIRTRDPGSVRRVGVELPQGAFLESQLLNQEMRDGARYPEGRSGNIDASVITGRGVQELLGGFDTQIKAAQTILGNTMRRVLNLCFEMDEKYWGGRKKTIRGTSNGAPFEVSYTPSKDIAGDYTIDVTYGFMAGMDPNRALVFMLQLRGDKAIPRDLLQRHLPIDINVSQMQQQIDIEETRDALKQAVFGYAEALPVLAQQGGDPSQILSRISTIIEGLQKGTALEQVVSEAFAPTPPAAGTPGSSEAAPAPGEEAAGGQPSGPEGLSATGRVPGVAAGQAGMGPGGRPDLQQLLAGLSSSGAPSLGATVLRRVPA